MIRTNSPSNHIPHVLNGIKIWRESRSDHRVDLLLLKVVGDDARAMSWSVVVLEHRARANCVECQQDKRPEDAVPVADAVQIANHTV